ncbi:protein MAINTENANCE OF MERISTEMS-like [Macadamia integrifolia]|uniref:protein MAINTENANCE OF MERISTEMS-like n=1 Tax=Macadamia integrifolia TaxID=60698 RepID=UPI001C4E65AD|nr:protein MAINTENANCE OF MERISTEMS-like [Macadamia integrifolia]
MVRSWYMILPRRVKEMIDSSCLCRLALIETQKFNLALVGPLMEKWWPSTHSFHVPVGEITITPLYFYASTGVPFGGRPMTRPETLTAREFADLTGLTIVTNQTHIHLRDISARWWRTDLWVNLGNMAQVIRSFLLFAMGQCLFSDLRVGVDICLVFFFEDLQEVDSWDWGGAIYAYLLWTLDLLSYGDRGLKGIGYILQPWCFEQLEISVPRLRDPQVTWRPF